jgi:hypothetical protein
MNNDGMPTTARWIADFLQRVGFPIFIAIAILTYHVWYVNTIQGKQDMNTERISQALDKNTDAVTALRHFLTHKYDN